MDQELKIVEFIPQPLQCLQMLQHSVRNMLHFTSECGINFFKDCGIVNWTSLFSNFLQTKSFV